MAIKTKHVPQRTCVGCGQKKPKKTLIRVVSVPDGNVEIDSTGKKSGRGVYLCPSAPCWEMGLEKRRVDYGLRTSLSAESRDRLIQESKELAGSNDNVWARAKGAKISQ